MLKLKERPSATAGFTIFSGALQASEIDGKKVIHTTASSAVELLNGDEITEDCIRDLVMQAKGGGMTIFLNHSYKVPEDVFGSSIGSDLVMRQTEFGTRVADMDLTMSVDESNPRAVQTYESIKNGTKIGVSIGTNIAEWEFRDKKARFDGGVRFKKLTLLETSMVGIPKNPRGWVQSAVMALHSMSEPDVFIDELDEAPEETAESHPELPDSAFAAVDTEGRHYPHHHKDGSIWMSLLRNALARVSDASNVQAGKGHLLRHAKEYGIGDHADAPDDQADNPVEIADVADAAVTRTAAPDPAADTDTESEPIADSPDADTSASVTGDEPQESNESTPDVTQSLPEVQDVVTTLAMSGADRVVIEMVLSTLEHTASELRVSRAEQATLEATVVTLTQERDAARQDLTEAAQIVEMLARLPLARKTAFAAPISSFQERFSGVYDAQYLKLIDERSKED